MGSLAAILALATRGAKVVLGEEFSLTAGTFSPELSRVFSVQACSRVVADKYEGSSWQAQS